MNFKPTGEKLMVNDVSLADFILGFDLNISIILYELALRSLDKAIKKAKMIEISQRNASRVVQYNVKMA